MHVHLKPLALVPNPSLPCTLSTPGQYKAVGGRWWMVNFLRRKIETSPPVVEGGELKPVYSILVAVATEKGLLVWNRARPIYNWHSSNIHQAGWTIFNCPGIEIIRQWVICSSCEHYFQKPEKTWNLVTLLQFRHPQEFYPRYHRFYHNEWKNWCASNEL